MTAPFRSPKNMAGLLSIAAGMLVVLCLIDGLLKVNEHLDATLKESRARWAVNSGLLSRAKAIHTQYDFLRRQFVPLWQEHDPAQMMARIDKAAKTAGVAVDNIRPLQTPVRNVLLLELNVRGSWDQLMSFLRIIEGNEHLFDVINVSISRKESTGELTVSVVIQRKIIESDAN